MPWRFFHRWTEARLEHRSLLDGDDVPAMLEDRAWHIALTVRVLEPDDAGQCAPHELPVMSAIAERFAQVLWDHAEMIVVAQVFADGACTIHAYGDERFGVDNWARQAMVPFPDHAWTLTCTLDPERAAWAALRPDPTERAVDDAIREAWHRALRGDDIDAAREVVHRLRLPDAPARAEVVRMLLSAGWDVEALRDDAPPLAFAVDLRKERSLQADVLAADVATLSDAAVERGGAWDGFDALDVACEGPLIAIPEDLADEHPEDADHLRERQLSGDRLDLHRSVTHHLWFPSATARVTAAAEARRLGFDVRVGHEPGEGMGTIGSSFEIVAERRDPLVPIVFLPVIGRLRALCDALGGHYDRWQAPITVLLDPTQPTADELAFATALQANLQSYTPAREAQAAGPPPSPPAPLPATSPKRYYAIAAAVSLALVLFLVWTQPDDRVVVGMGVEAPTAASLASLGVDPGDPVVMRHIVYFEDEEGAEDTRRRLVAAGFEASYRRYPRGFLMTVTAGATATPELLLEDGDRIRGALSPDGAYAGWTVSLE